MYSLQSVPVTAARWNDAAMEAVVDPSVPARVPHATAPPGASALLVPGAKPTIVKSNGALTATVPGTRKATASMGFAEGLNVVPVPSQHFELKLVKGTKLGPCASVIV